MIRIAGRRGGTPARGVDAAADRARTAASVDVRREILEAPVRVADGDSKDPRTRMNPEVLRQVRFIEMRTRGLAPNSMSGASSASPASPGARVACTISTM